MDFWVYRCGLSFIDTNSHRAIVSHTWLTTDPPNFVFDAFTEEVGFIGALALLAFYLVFVYRGMLIALRAPTTFLQLLAAGLSFIVAFQTLVIVGGNAKLIPLTGITLPFVAYGGSSLVTNFVLVALLLRVSDITAKVRR